VARTVDPAAHALRRGAFLDAAQRLIQAKGYDQMSVQDLLADLGTSKGAFYHYFDSKQALLQALLERIADTLQAHLAPIAAEPGRPPLDRLQRLFAALAGWKTQRRDLLLAMLQVWYSDDNAVVRQKLRPRLADRMAPLLARIVRDGVAEGVFTTRYPDQTSRVLVGLILDLNDALGELLLAGELTPAVPVSAERLVAAHTDALERVLGVPSGSLVLVDAATLTTWFAPPQTG
jgi:AcrR family transcriptional regulator